jgi:multiple sugar transport system ATP-binding protein
MNFLPAQLVEDGGKTAVEIKSAAGPVAKLALYNGATSRAAGKDVILGVRPEHIFRYSADLKAQKPGMATLAAPVELVEPTGAETMAVMKIGDTEIVGRFDPDDAPHMGENITLGIDMAHACLFEPSTQKLI